jgi:hypothetical protein
MHIKNVKIVSNTLKLYCSCFYIFLPFRFFYLSNCFNHFRRVTVEYSLIRLSVILSVTIFYCFNYHFLSFSSPTLILISSFGLIFFSFLYTCGRLECSCTSYENLGELEKEIRHQFCIYTSCCIDLELVNKPCLLIRNIRIFNSVAEPHHFYAAPASI